MPRYYEEAAHLLFVMLAHGAAVSSRDCDAVVRFMASVLDDLIIAHRSHAEAADVMLSSLTLWGFVTIDPGRNKRLNAIIGTMIGNVMTLNPATVKR